MKITEFVREDLIVPELAARDKAGVIEEMAARLSERVPALQKDALVRVLMEREKLASTAIGEGVAIPHGKLDAVGKLVACVGRAPKARER